MRPVNTATQDPLLNLFTSVEAQEARGQRELVQSESLPSECSNRGALEVAGVKFGQPYPDDPLFCPVTLPAGWKKSRTDHSMHSELLDEKGRKRASIFYKAAHYDRRADMYPMRRYNISIFEDGSDDQHRRAVVKDGDTVIHDLGERPSDDYKASDVVQKDAEAWLTEHYPDWQSPAAYWD